MASCRGFRSTHVAASRCWVVLNEPDVCLEGNPATENHSTEETACVYLRQRHVAVLLCWWCHADVCLGDTAVQQADSPRVGWIHRVSSWFPIYSNAAVGHTELYFHYSDISCNHAEPHLDGCLKGLSTLTSDWTSVVWSSLSLLRQEMFYITADENPTSPDFTVSSKKSLNI